MHKSPRPWGFTEPVTPAPKPLNKGEPVPEHPIHFILHEGWREVPAGKKSEMRTIKVYLDYRDMRELYALENEPHVSRFHLDVIDEKGALHLMPPLLGQKPLHLKEYLIELHRGARAYRRLIESGTLYTGRRTAPYLEAEDHTYKYLEEGNPK